MDSCWLLVEDEADVVVDVEMTAITDVVVVVEETLLGSGSSSLGRCFRFGRFFLESSSGERLVGPANPLKLVRRRLRRPEVEADVLPEVVVACFVSCDLNFFVDARSFRTIQ